MLESDGNLFPRTVSTSSLEAQSGTNHDKTNSLAGTMVIGGTSVTIPGGVLDPGYEPGHFEASYACKPKLQLVTSDEECAFTRPLAVGAARLIIQSVGTIGSMVNKDTVCGFDATLVRLRPQQVVGNAGQMGSMSWGISNCQVGQPAPVQFDQDCGGARRMISGTASVNATRTVVGLREKVLLVVDSIVPKTRQAVSVRLNSVDLHELAAYSLPAGAIAPRARLTIHSGMLSAVIKPVLGERRSAPGTFDLPTPVSALTEVRLTNARVTLESGAKTFVFTIPSAELSAFNGSYMGATNSLSGTITVGAGPVTLGAMALNPEFDQMTLDSSYSCTPDLGCDSSEWAVVGKPSGSSPSPRPSPPRGRGRTVSGAKRAASRCRHRAARARSRR